MKMLHCNSDTPQYDNRGGRTVSIASTNYMACWGDVISATALNSAFKKRGVFGNASAIKISDITDGTSNTLALSERVFKMGAMSIFGNIAANIGATISSNPTLCLLAANQSPNQFNTGVVMDGYYGGTRWNDGMTQFETGLLVTPFLPGDSLLFTLGAMCMSINSELNLPAMAVTLLVAAVLGDAVNYSLGYWTGPRVFKFEKSFLLNKDHLLKAQGFYEKYGKKMIILARFVPIIRTFAPFVAGIGKMTYPTFLAYNVIGAIAWVGLCMGAGVLFGQIPWVKKNFEVVILGVIFISILPLVYEFVLSRYATKKTTLNAIF